MKTDKSQPSREPSTSEDNSHEAMFQRAHLRLDVAKQRMRLAKEELKRARKRYKEAKRMSKRARKEAVAARKAWKRAEPKAVKQADKKVAAEQAGTLSSGKVLRVSSAKPKLAVKGKSVATKRAPAQRASRVANRAAKAAAKKSRRA
jgi:hypothetical protein